MGIKSYLLTGLGLFLWGKDLKKNNKEEAKECFKKAIYYSLLSSNNISFSNLECFMFRSCDKYLFEMLINEQICVSSPRLFNDPFDCPIFHLSVDDNDLKIQKEAYEEVLRVACFARNNKLQYKYKKEKKRKRGRVEYLNELMWAHYAEGHQGVCFKYHFAEGLFIPHEHSSDRVCLFKDVEYIDNFDRLSIESGLTQTDAIFVKSKSWAYENVL